MREEQKKDSNESPKLPSYDNDDFFEQDIDLSKPSEVKFVESYNELEDLIQKVTEGALESPLNKENKQKTEQIDDNIPIVYPLREEPKIEGVPLRNTSKEKNIGKGKETKEYGKEKTYRIQGKRF